MKVGHQIIFNIDHWNKNGQHSIQEEKREVERISINPMNGEKKAIISISGEEYGIPETEIKEIIPCGEQLEIF
jgi:hypothetical protein